MSAIEVQLADVVAVACAEAFRGDGEIFASGMGTMPMLGARLARSTFEPDLLVSDGEAFFVGNELPIGGTDKLVEGWIPFRSVFDTLWGGRRHVMMGASQIDRFGNSNIANIGPWDRPKAQLLGVRGGPGNTINHATSFWIPNHTAKVFVDQVDMVSGLGYDRAARPVTVGPGTSRAAPGGHQPGRARLRDARSLGCDSCRVHPGVTVDQVRRSDRLRARRRGRRRRDPAARPTRSSPCSTGSTRRACGTARCPTP